VKKLNEICAVVALGFVAVGCQSDVDLEPAGPAPTRAPFVTGGAQELRAEADATLAFRAESGAFRAGHLTHDVRMTEAAITFTPSHWDGGRTIVGAPVSLWTRAVHRGDRALGSDVIASRVVDGRVELDRGELFEHVENRAEGIEQSWAFDAEPSGRGDLVVSVAVEGFADAVATSTGLHFHTPGRLGVHYSHATWLDSAGQAWDLSSTWDGRQIQIVVPADMIARTRFPAVLDPTVGAEKAVDSVANGFTGLAAREPAAAFSGSTWLVVWRDNRTGDTANSDVYGARVASDGTVLDPFGIKISTTPGTNQATPAVTFANGRWIVAWDDESNIAAATVGTGGNVAQLGTVSGAAAVETNPVLAAHGNQALLVWQSDSDVYAARYTGTFGAPFAIAATANAEVRPVAAGDPGGGYLVAWTEGATNENIRGQLLDGAGAPSGAAFDIAAGNGRQTQPAAAFNGTDYVVTFTNLNTDIYGTRVTTAGAVLDTHLDGTLTVGGAPISTAAGAQVNSNVGCGAAECLVVWADRRAIATNATDVYGQRIDLGFVFQGGEIAISSQGYEQALPTVAAGASGWLAGWQDNETGGSFAIVGSRITAAGAVQDPTGIVMNLSRNQQLDPAYSRGPSFSLAVWSDSRTYGNNIRGVRYDASNAKVDASGVPIASSSSSQVSATAAWDGAQFLVAWDDGRNETHDIFAGRFSTSGTGLDPGGIAVTTAANDQLDPDVASNGSVSLVVWQDRRDQATSGFDIYGAIVTPGGTIGVADIPICTQTGDQNRPAVAWDGANGVFVVVWSDLRVAGNADIFATRVDAAGNVLDGTGVQVSGAANGQFTPDIAASGSQLLAVWDDRRTDTGDIYGSRLTAAGSLSVLDPGGLAINASADAQSAPTTLGIFGGAFVVMWADRRDFATTLADIYGVQVDASGTTTSAVGFPISTSPEHEGNPNLQSDPNTGTHVQVVYSRFNTSVNAARVYRRGITWEGSPGATCTSDAQCGPPGFCVDGYCCDSACGGSFNSTDCQACSVARGATANGTCSVVTNTATVCRGLADYPFVYCDIRERCDGINPSCPEDVGRHQFLPCTGSAGPGTCPANDSSGAPHVCQ
jgi:hypothetical protein